MHSCKVDTEVQERDVGSLLVYQTVLRSMFSDYALASNLPGASQIREIINLIILITAPNITRMNDQPNTIAKLYIYILLMLLVWLHRIAHCVTLDTVCLFQMVK